LQRAREAIKSAEADSAANHQPAVSHSAAPDSFLVCAETVAGSAPRTAEDAAISALTRRLVAGEEAAWREFHDAYFDRLLRYLLVVCHGDETAARTALQASLVKIVRSVRRSIAKMFGGAG
jgi:hypothetical protein